ncbi:DUF3397 domain-containing protein [Sporosarcina luteola]|uniref:DUF3397 domain-containing protein n=1 Tax=Sporosarcina luteola TaxID=582850 RepID=UPI00204131A5|nr:DUF3397 domain-containing protein [Sporosarcina luteola]MCM3742742.1 DUF3397 domain-containing protein [Sporosarcina luteola]
MVNVFLSILFGILVVCPFIITIVFLIIMRRMGKAPAAVIRNAADFTTAFLFLSVYITSMTIFGKGTGFYLTSSAILIAIFVAIVERVKEKEFKIGRVMHKTWRLFFLLLSFSYVILLVMGITFKILEYVK